jgi:hypothetical protein
MAITFEWRGYDGNDWNFVIQPTNLIGFYGSGGYGSPIEVGQYNDSMHIRTSTTDDTDACPPPHLTNIKYINDTECEVNGTRMSLTSVQKEHLIMLKVISDSTISIIGTRFYAYDGQNVDNPPQNLIVKAFTLGNSAWSDIGGRANALSLGTSESATEHYFYVGISVSPTSSGATTVGVFRFEIDVQ